MTTPAELSDTLQRIESVTVRTPNRLLSEEYWPRPDVQVSLKLECDQVSGSFKARGARHFVARLLEREAPPQGVITYSSGNHGRAVAEAARDAGLPAAVTVPDHVDSSKKAAMEKAGAEVILAGPTSTSREERARELAAERHWEVIPPFDHEWIILGQSTCTLEILNAESADYVWVPVGGGGLSAGAALATRTLGRGQVWAVEPEGAAVLHASKQAGAPVTWESTDSIADGLLPVSVGSRNWAILSDPSVHSTTVTDDQIQQSLRILRKQLDIPAEPSGAVAPAALLCPTDSQREQLPPGRHVAVVSGRNVSEERLARLLR